MSTTISRRSQVAFAAIFALVVLSVPGRAIADWLPLAVGNQWHYTSPTDPPHDETITATRTLAGRRASIPGVPRRFAARRRQ